jgi:diadenosine tetraphosphate (Ap4A) HIT family hydrolase
MYIKKMSNMSKTCPFCTSLESRVFLENDLALAILDGFPISEGHSLIIPKRHVNSIFEIQKNELLGLFNLLTDVKNKLTEQFSPDGFNIGINDNEAAGQTINHLHIHLIPRYKGDQKDPRGGIRWIFPDKAKYWE